MEVHLVRVDLVVVGSLSGDLVSVAAGYEQRLKRYVRLSVHELKAEPTSRGYQVVTRAEGDRFLSLLARIKQEQRNNRTAIVALDSSGHNLTTNQLCEQWLSPSHLVLLIGGSMGLAKSVLSQANSSVAFGRITLPHQIARIVATEQLYRAFRIVRGEPYHY